MSKNATNQDSLVKSVGMVLLGIIVLALFYNVFFNPASMNPYSRIGGYGGMGGYGGAGEHMGGGYYPMGAGFDFSLGALLGGILLILVKLLSILLVVGLVVGVWVVVKDYLFTDGENPLASLTRGFAGSKAPCPKCGTQVDAQWAYCQVCGEAINRAGNPAVQNPNAAQS